MISEAPFAAYWETNLLVSYGLEACGVCSLGPSIIRHRRLCAASRPCQYHQLPAQQDRLTEKMGLEDLRQGLHRHPLALILPAAQAVTPLPLQPW